MESVLARARHRTTSRHGALCVWICPDNLALSSVRERRARDGGGERDDMVTGSGRPAREPAGGAGRRTRRRAPNRRPE